MGREGEGDKILLLLLFTAMPFIPVYFMNPQIIAFYWNGYVLFEITCKLHSRLPKLGKQEIPENIRLSKPIKFEKATHYF